VSRTVGKGRPTKTSRITPRQQKYIDHYLLHRKPEEAARTAGYSTPGVMGYKLLDPKQFPLVAKACSEALAEQSKRTLLKADDVLRYIHSAIEFNPLKWFIASEDGDWIITEENYRSLPDEVGKLIEKVTRKVKEVEVNGETKREVWFKVEFVSKTVAMSLAAKHQLGEKMTVTTVSVNWDDLLKGKPMLPSEDPIEVEILSIKPNPAKLGPNSDETSSD